MLYIIRHGQTQMNQAMQLQGRSDHPLNDDGCKQAEEAGNWLREKGIEIDKVYSSPLVRALQTAQLAGKSKIPVVIDERLIEMDYGPYEGTDLTNLPPEILEFFRDFANTPAPEGMEQLGSVVRRLGEFLEEIRDEAEHGNILISTHAIAMKGALEYLTPESHGSYWSKHIGNCAIYQAEVRNGQFGIPEEIR